jgi:hypothetical protein
MAASVPENSEINDIRSAEDFRIISFSNYKKTEVKEALIENMKKGKIEPACYWGAELVAAGHYMDLWEIILHYTAKYIHLGNPKLVIYLERRYEIFREIMQRGQYITELHLRNNSKIRQLFAEVISVLTTSNKKHSFEAVKINRLEEFDMTQMSERFKAPSTDYATSIFKKDDPKELFIAINEFVFELGRKNMLTACYWIEWVIEFDLICKKRKEPVFCDRRTDIPVELKFQRDIIWLIWDGIFSATFVSPLLEKIAQSIFHLFCIKYTTAAAKRRRYLLYFAVALITETVNLDTEMILKKELIQIVLGKIHEIYKQIKKNEQSPKTEYLYSNLEKDRENAFEQSMRKMEMLQNIEKL